MTKPAHEIMERKANDDADQSVQRSMRVLLYAGDRYLTVESPPHPGRQPGDGVCRCAACRAVAVDDLAAIVR